MEQLQSFIGQINSYAWGIPMLILILGTGLFLSVGLKIMTILRIPFAFRLLWQGRIPNDDAGEISPFNALMTSLSATIGTGKYCRCCHRYFPRRPRGCLLDVGHSNGRHGHQICRGRLCC